MVSITRTRFFRGIALACLLLISSLQATAAPARAPPVKHVFIIVLENKNFEDTFGSASAAPYLARTLTKRGVLLQRYYGIGHASLDNYIAMISGQAATPETRDDCETYSDFVLQGMTLDGQAVGHGCVYPMSIRTLADQVTGLGKTWRGYMEDMGNDPQRERATCGHPALNERDGTQDAEAPSAQHPRGDQYAARHNPFVYFHSIIDSPDCDTSVVRLENLEHDLASARSTPNVVFIVPNLCNDGHDMPCKTGQPGGLPSADGFLKTWVPRIQSSEAYRRDGLLVIMFDEGDAQMQAVPTGYVVDYVGEKCCDEQPGPNLKPFPQTEHIDNYTIHFADFGGDRTGAVLLSPFLEPGTLVETPFDHYSLLKTLEDLLGAQEHLGYAARPGLVGFFDEGSHVRLRVENRSRRGETSHH
jgi:phosphatidylinositol-3-phosphatase